MIYNTWGDNCTPMSGGMFICLPSMLDQDDVAFGTHVNSLARPELTDSTFIKYIMTRRSNLLT